MVNFYQISIGISIVIYSFFIIRLSRIQTPDARHFMHINISVVILASGTLLELISDNYNQKIFFRNLQQIGMFYMPMFLWIFVRSYTGYKNWKWLDKVVVALQTSGLVLVFTDGYHHIMRKSIALEQHPLFGPELTVKSTVAGSIFVSFNFVIAGISLIMFLIFLQKISLEARRQLSGVGSGIFLTIFFAALKTYFLEPRGILIPIAVILLPAGYAIYRKFIGGRIFKLVPIARTKIFDVMTEGILVLSADGMIVDFNPAMKGLVSLFFSGSDISVGNDVDRLFQGKFTMESLALSHSIVEIKEPQTAFLSFDVHPVSDGPAYSGYVILVKEVTSEVKQERTLLYKSQRDPMTGALNREGFRLYRENNLGNSDSPPETFFPDR